MGKAINSPNKILGVVGSSHSLGSAWCAGCRGNAVQQPVCSGGASSALSHSVNSLASGKAGAEQPTGIAALQREEKVRVDANSLHVVQQASNQTSFKPRLRSNRDPVPQTFNLGCLLQGTCQFANQGDKRNMSLSPPLPPRIHAKVPSCTPSPGRATLSSGLVQTPGLKIIFFLISFGLRNLSIGYQVCFWGLGFRHPGPECDVFIRALQTWKACLEKSGHGKLQRPSLS